MRTVEDKIKLGVFPGFKFSHCPGDLLFLPPVQGDKVFFFFFFFFKEAEPWGIRPELKILFAYTCVSAFIWQMIVPAHGKRVLTPSFCQALY